MQPLRGKPGRRRRTSVRRADGCNPFEVDWGGSLESKETIMRCWNCNHRVDKNAKVCARCEADLTRAPSAEEIEAMEAMLRQLPPDVFANMEEAVRATGSAEEFANRILVGPCPRCRSDQTSHCED